VQRKQRYSSQLILNTIFALMATILGACGGGIGDDFYGRFGYSYLSLEPRVEVQIQSIEGKSKVDVVVSEADFASFRTTSQVTGQKKNCFLWIFCKKENVYSDVPEEPSGKEYKINFLFEDEALENGIAGTLKKSYELIDDKLNTQLVLLGKIADGRKQILPLNVPALVDIDETKPFKLVQKVTQYGYELEPEIVIPWISDRELNLDSVYASEVSTPQLQTQSYNAGREYDNSYPYNDPEVSSESLIDNRANRISLEIRCSDNKDFSSFPIPQVKIEESKKAGNIHLRASQVSLLMKRPSNLCQEVEIKVCVTEESSNSQSEQDSRLSLRDYFDNPKFSGSVTRCSEQSKMKRETAIEVVQL